MTRKELLKFSLITIIIGVLLLALTFFFFHFVTDEGVTLIWHEEAGKPLVTFLIGILGILFVFASAISLIISFILKERE